MSLAQAAKATELLMFESEYCTWCHQWNKEIGGIYSITPESCQAPLRRIDLDTGIPKSINLAEVIVYTPTFVLMHDNHEVARITGYPGSDFFFPMLNDAITKNIPEETQRQNSLNCEHS